MYCAEHYIQCPLFETNLLSYHKTIFVCLSPFSQTNDHLMIIINKETGLITGITATASYLLHSYSKTKTKQNKTPNKQTEKAPPVGILLLRAS